jgi:tetratricopeptide (TPR) repeat protein
MDDRMRCLDGHLRDLESTIDALEHADARVIQNAVGAVERLPAISDCSAARVARSAAFPGQGDAMDPETAAALMHVHVLIGLTDNDAAEAEVEPVLEQAESRGDRRVQAEARFALGDIARMRGQVRATALLAEAVSDAESVGRDELVAEAALTLSDALLRADESASDSKRWFGLAQGAAHRIGDPDMLLAKLSLQNTQLAMHDGGERQPAIDAAHEALTFIEDHLPNAPIELALALSALGEVEYDSGHPTQALAAYSRCLDVYSSAIGADNPLVYPARANVAMTQLDLGQWDAALASYEHLASIHDPRVSPQNTVNALTSLAGIYIAKRRYGDADEAIRRALEETTRLGGTKHREYGWLISTRGDLERRLGQFDLAVRDENDALDVLRDTIGPDRLETVDAWMSLALAYLDMGRPDLANRPAASAERILSRGGPPDRLAQLFFVQARLAYAKRADAATVRKLLAQARAADPGQPGAAQMPNETEEWFARHAPNLVP